MVFGIYIRPNLVKVRATFRPFLLLLLEASQNDGHCNSWVFTEDVYDIKSMVTIETLNASHV